MEKLIPIDTYEGEKCISARELHSFLQVRERFSKWFSRMESYGFNEFVDYTGCTEKYTRYFTHSNQPLQDFALTLDCAKEISMIQRSEKGKEARKYFINCEKMLKEVASRSTDNLPDISTHAGALRVLAQNALELADASEQLAIAAPKVELYDLAMSSNEAIDFMKAAKVLHPATGLGRTNLMAELRKRKILMSNAEYKNVPYQRFLDAGHFEVIETPYVNNKTGETHLSFKTLATQKGLDYLTRVFSKSQSL